MKYNLKWIKLSNLSVIWKQSQREVNQAWADEIGQNFDPDLFAPPDVTKPNGKGEYHVIDGQHRIIGARTALGENQEVPCRVYSFDDPAKAADMFARINEKRKRPNQIDMFKVKVTAGHEDEVAVNNIVFKSGYSVGFNSLSSISCPAALVAVYSRLGGQVLAQTIQVLSATYGGSTASMMANNIKGFAAFIAQYRDANIGRLVACVRKHYPDHGQLAAAIKQYKDLNNIAGSETASLAVLVAAYNRGRGPKLRLPV